MRVFRRSLVALAIAAMLPTVVFAAVGIFYFLHVERDRVESATLRRATTVMNLVDSRLNRDLAVLSVLSTSVTLEAEDWPRFHQRVQLVLHDNPGWQDVVLIDAQRNEEILAASRQLRAPQPLSGLRAAGSRAASAASATHIAGVERAGDPVVWIYEPIRRDASVRYVLAAAVRTRVFQDILLANASRSTTAAVVDRSGNFIARSLHYEARVGRPATQYVRAAIARGSHGFYPGQTYEGLKNYTAYYSSELSKWSTHIAVASSLIDTPTAWSFAVAGLAGLGSVLLAGVLVVLVLRDTGERRRADEALRQSQKMEAVGQLTGGIAHDFNNLLTAVIGNLDMIRNRVEGNERLQRLADNALEGARRGAKLAAQLLAFSRTQRMTVRRIDLQHVLDGMSGLLIQSVGPSVQVHVHIDEDAKFVVSDANQLELALLNLAVNARDAMSGSGTLTIRAQRAAHVDRSLLPRGEYVNLCVTDTGRGMPEDVRVKAIEPFFTTKPTGQGTGLGLSQVYGVVRESGGTLRLDSQPGKGTTVCLILRSARLMPEPPPTRPVERPEERPAPEVAHQTSVLVVDDDRLVRRFMVDSLRNTGYRVIEAQDGATALELLQTNAVDVLLVDFAMPDMNGAEVARLARSRYPDLRILIVSGYADTATLEAAAGSVAQLRKPFNLAELRAAVTEVLKGRP